MGGQPRPQCLCTGARGPGSRLGRGSGARFENKVSRKVGCVLASNEVHFFSVADNLTV